jgi:FKBP-type peptidyl-prolyl cis-trans isomerase
MLNCLLVPLLALAAAPAWTAPQDGDPVMPPDRGEVATTASGLKYSVLQPAQGPSPKAGTKVTVHYSGWLTDGTLFDSSKKRGQPFTFVLGQGQVIKGWDEGVALMQKGSRYRFTIPPELAYGEIGAPPTIPASATLVFEVELLDFLVMPEFRPADPEKQQKLESGLIYEVIEPGEGEPVPPGKICEVEYALFTTGGELVDASAIQGRNIKETCGQSQFGFMNEVLPRMKPGARWRLEVPPELAFGKRQVSPKLPPDSTTVWEVALVAVHEPLAMPEFRPLDDTRAVTTPSGLRYEVLEAGTGASPRMGQNVTVHYAGWLTDGTLFDASYRRGEPASFMLGRVIQGWNEGLQQMKEGGVFLLEIPAKLGYGKRGSPPTIPPDATLIFHVQLIRVGS